MWSTCSISVWKNIWTWTGTQDGRCSERTSSLPPLLRYSDAESCIKETYIIEKKPFHSYPSYFEQVELHIHLDGSMRHETIYELAKAKGLQLPGDGSFTALKNFLIVSHGVSLADFLQRFDLMLSSIRGDLEALERIAYEFVEDSANQGIAYFEARFCPHLLMNSHVAADLSESRKEAWEVTGALLKGLEKGEREFKTKGHLIVSVIRGRQQHWFDQALELANDSSFHGGRVVGLDVAGCSNSAAEDSIRSDAVVDMCRKAAELGIPRTIHAGESGEGKMVAHAVDELHAMRIGHGYRITGDKDVYNRIQKSGIHLETCPWSSILTASVPPTQFPHPIVQFFEDDFNISVNTDDPAVTGTQLDDEYNLLRKWGVPDHCFVKANFNAARSSFLPEQEKADLIQSLAKTYGVVSKNFELTSSTLIP